MRGFVLHVYTVGNQPPVCAHLLVDIALPLREAPLVGNVNLRRNSAVKKSTFEFDFRAHLYESESDVAFNGCTENPICCLHVCHEQRQISKKNLAFALI